MAGVQLTKIEECKIVKEKSRMSVNRKEKLAKRFDQLFGSTSPISISKNRCIANSSSTCQKPATTKRPGDKHRSTEGPAAKRPRVSTKPSHCTPTKQPKIDNEDVYPSRPPTPRYLVGEDIACQGPDWDNWYDTLPYEDESKQRAAELIDKRFDELFDKRFDELFGSPERHLTVSYLPKPVPVMPTEIPKTSTELPKKPTEHRKKPTKHCKKPMELPKNATEPTKKSTELTKKLAELPKVTTEISKMPTEYPKLPMNLPKIPRYGESATAIKTINNPVADDYDAHMDQLPAKQAADVAKRSEPKSEQVKARTADPSTGGKRRVAHKRSTDILAMRPTIGKTSESGSATQKTQDKSTSSSSERTASKIHTNVSKSRMNVTQNQNYRRTFKRLHDSLDQVYRQQIAAKRASGSFI